MIVLGPCSIAPIAAIRTVDKDGAITVREPKRGWHYFGCTQCGLRIWTPPGVIEGEFECKRVPALGAVLGPS